MMMMMMTMTARIIKALIIIIGSQVKSLLLCDINNSNTFSAILLVWIPVAPAHSLRPQSFLAKTRKEKSKLSLDHNKPK